MGRIFCKIKKKLIIKKKKNFYMPWAWPQGKKKKDIASSRTSELREET